MTNHDEIRAVLRTFAARNNLLNQAEDALSELQGYDGELVPTLINALSDPDDEVRLLVMRLLWELGTKAEPAIPAMINALEDNNRIIRLSAAGLVARFGEKAKAAIPILETWIGSNDQFSHVTALGTILMINHSKAGDLMPVLIDALESDDGKLRVEAIWQLELLGELALDAVPALRRLLDDHSTASMSASDAIFEITGDPTDAIKVGIDLLDDDDWLQRYLGGEHLQSLGPKAHSAIPRLQRAAQDDENDAVRNAAQSALSEIEAYKWQSQL